MNLDKLTKKQLKDLGVIHIESKAYPNRFFIPIAGEKNIYPPYYIMDVYREIYLTGLKDGLEKGKKEKIEEIKKALNID